MSGVRSSLFRRHGRLLRVHAPIRPGRRCAGAAGCHGVRPGREPCGAPKRPERLVRIERSERGGASWAKRPCGFICTAGIGRINSVSSGASGAVLGAREHARGRGDSTLRSFAFRGLALRPPCRRRLRPPLRHAIRALAGALLRWGPRAARGWPRARLPLPCSAALGERAEPQARPTPDGVQRGPEKEALPAHSVAVTPGGDGRLAADFFRRDEAGRDVPAGRHPAAMPACERRGGGVGVIVYTGGVSGKLERSGGTSHGREQLR